MSKRKAVPPDGGESIRHRVRWAVLAAARSAPERGEELVRALAERIGIPVEKVQIAVSYYGEYSDDVDQFIAANEQEAEQLERALENERRLLG